MTNFYYIIITKNFNDYNSFANYKSFIIKKVISFILKTIKIKENNIYIKIALIK